MNRVPACGFIEIRCQIFWYTIETVLYNYIIYFWQWQNAYIISSEKDIVQNIPQTSMNVSITLILV
jgi:hypothetical protein